MGKLYNELQKQLEMPEHRKDAEDCIKIYDKLKELLSMALNLERAADEANKQINFAKHLLLKYPDTSVELSNEELNKEWHEVIK